MYIKELTNKEYKSFIQSFSIKSIYQTPEYGFVMNHEGFDSIFLGLIDDNNILAASLILIEKRSNFKYAYAPKGFLIDYDNFDLLKTFTTEIKKYLQRLNIIAIRINPKIIKNEYQNNEIIENINYNSAFINLKKLDYKHLGYNDYFEGLKPRFEAIIELNAPYYILFKKIRKEFKTKIRSAEKNGIKIYKGNVNNLDYIYNQTEKKYPRKMEYFQNIFKFYKASAELYYAKLDTVKYLKTASKNLTEQESLCNKLNEQLYKDKSVLPLKMSNDLLLNKYKNNLVYATKLVSENPDGVILSTIIIIKNNNEIYSLIDGYNPKYKRLNSKHLLIWKIIEKYSNLGFKNFNLGGIVNPKATDNKYIGLNEFKLSFDSKTVEFAGDFELITNKPLYFMYKNSFKK